MGSNRGMNLIGNKFGKLVVKESTGRTHPKRGRIYLCVCECGNEKEAATSHLKYGNVKSCGCLRIEKAVELGRRSNRMEISPYTKKPREIKELPPELEGVESKIILNGLFQVFKNGRIFRIYDRGKIECPQFKTSRNGKYLAVSRMVDGKQKHFYVHRLIATAFIPNPLDKPQINHKDGNPSNNAIENLEWVTASENVQHAHDSGLIDFYKNALPCLVCEQPTNSKIFFCLDCDKIRRSEESKYETKMDIKKSVSDISLSLLSEVERESIELRSQGKSLQEIGDIQNVTRETIRLRIKKSKLKSDPVQQANSIDIRAEKLSKNTLWIKRKTNSLTQSDVAGLLGLSAAAYCKKENRENDFLLSEAVKLSDLFDTPVHELFSEWF